MVLSDHIRTLLRDHDCVIIPDFGGLIADYAPARIHPVRHTLAPPAKRVAFNPALVRNDGLLVDVLSQKLHLSTAQARQMVREAVANMQQELEASQRTELPGIGVFRRAAGRSLDFEYCGTDNLLAASFGLPELVSRPVRATDALNSRERPAAAPLLGPAGRANRNRRVLGGVAAAMIAGLILSANYMGLHRLGFLPAAWRTELLQPAAKPAAPAANASPVSAAPAVSRQQADLAVADNFAPEEPATKPAMVVPAPSKPATKPAAVGKAADGQKRTATKSAKTVKPAKPAGKAPGWEKAAPANAVPAGAGTAMKQQPGRFYVVAGSYTSLANAEKGRQALARIGHSGARVVLPKPGSRQYKLSVADFTDRTSAERQASLLRKRMGTSLWILK